MARKPAVPAEDAPTDPIDTIEPPHPPPADVAPTQPPADQPDGYEPEPPSYRIEKSEDHARVPNPWLVIDNRTGETVSRHGTVTDARTARDQRLGTP